MARSPDMVHFRILLACNVCAILEVGGGFLVFFQNDLAGKGWYPEIFFRSYRKLSKHGSKESGPKTGVTKTRGAKNWR